LWCLLDHHAHRLPLLLDGFGGYHYGHQSGSVVDDLRPVGCFALCWRDSQHSGIGQRRAEMKHGKKAVTSITLFAVCWGILLMDGLGILVLSSGMDVISSRLHDQLQVLATLSLPLVFILVIAGFVVGLLDWVRARKGHTSPSRLTVAATLLNLASVVLGLLAAGWLLWMVSYGLTGV
jgi:hypothetical protein